MRHPVEHKIDIGDVELCVYEWAGTTDPVLLLHATGFHSRCWNQVVKQLPDQHIYAVDLRFHGASGSAGDVDWAVLAKDIEILLEHFQLRELVGVGHSIGGHLLARVAAAMPDRFKQLVLVDPVIMPPSAYRKLDSFTGGMKATDHPVSRRKNRWQDADEMYQRFHSKPPFDSWQGDVLRDYCDYALHPADEEGYRLLLCDPINEASIYLNQDGNEAVHEMLPSISTPVTLLRAPPGDGTAQDLATSPTWPELAGALQRCREIYLPHMNHFIPMQDPDLIVRYIHEAQQNSWQSETEQRANTD